MPHFRKCLLTIQMTMADCGHQMQTSLDFRQQRGNRLACNTFFTINGITGERFFLIFSVIKKKRF